MRVCKPNWDWAIELTEALHTEWKRRYKHPADKIHKSFGYIMILKEIPPTKFEEERDTTTPFCLCTFPECKVEGDPVTSYR